MKRLIACILMLSLILLAGCSVPEAEQIENPETLPTVAPNEYLACIALTTFNSKEEYDTFMEADGDKLPEDFFSWEDASQFGEVSHMVLLGSSKYMYSIVDKIGHRYYIEINRCPELVSTKSISEKDFVGTDLRKVTNKSGADFYFKRGDLIYDVSDNGDLYAIIFYMGGVEIKLDGTLWEYPINRADTVISKLLSTDEAVANAAFAEITEKLSK